MKPNYLELSKIKPSDRTFLIDWIVKIHKSSKLSHKCLFLSVVTIDRFLQARVPFYCTIWLFMLTITHFVCFRLMLISWNVIYNLLAWLHCALLLNVKMMSKIAMKYIPQILSWDRAQIDFMFIFVSLKKTKNKNYL